MISPFAAGNHANAPDEQRTRICLGTTHHGIRPTRVPGIESRITILTHYGAHSGGGSSEMDCRDPPRPICVPKPFPLGRRVRVGGHASSAPLSPSGALFPPPVA